MCLRLSYNAFQTVQCNILYRGEISDMYCDNNVTKVWMQKNKKCPKNITSTWHCLQWTLHTHSLKVSYPSMYRQSSQMQQQYLGHTRILSPFFSEMLFHQLEVRPGLVQNWVAAVWFYVAVYSIQGCTVLWWLAPSPHSKRFPGSTGGLSVWSVHVLPRVCVGSLRVLRLPPTVQKHAC